MANDEPLVATESQPNAISEPMDDEHGRARKPKPIKQEKTRRGGIKHKSKMKVKFSLLGNNTAGLKAKKDSLEASFTVHEGW